MRNILVLLLAVCACGDDGGSGKVDAAIDAAAIADASPDAPFYPDAPTVTVTSACTNMCNKLGTCFGDTDPENLQDCIDSCQTDLADCSADQVSDADACSQATCTGDDPEQWEVVTCIASIPCVDTPV